MYGMKRRSFEGPGTTSEQGMIDRMWMEQNVLELQPVCPISVTSGKVRHLQVGTHTYTDRVRLPTTCLFLA